MSWRTRLAQWLDPALTVTAVPVGRTNDGLILRPTAGTPLDPAYAELFADVTDAREAWRKHPLAKRLIGLTTAYVVGNGIAVSSTYPPLQRFISRFWAANQLDARLPEWVDELGRAGELFPVLFTNPVDGMSAVRVVPAQQIIAVDYDLDDYERELRYAERLHVGSLSPEKWWMGRGADAWTDPTQPLMLHFAVNRPVGALRGESDLAAILPWLRRYGRWLEDRVRLNAAMRAFLWVVKAPARLRADLVERYRQPPEPGSIIVAEPDEEWSAVTPSLHAADAERDGRALRWMIVAGGPGTALLDIGEGEDSNLATGQAMQEQRRRFLRRRQAVVAVLLQDLLLAAWDRYRFCHPPQTGEGRGGVSRYRAATHADLAVRLPDISPEDNLSLAQAAAALTTALEGLARLTGDSPALRTLAVTLWTKFAGEDLSADALNALTQGRPYAPAPDPAQPQP